MLKNSGFDVDKGDYKNKECKNGENTGFCFLSHYAE